MIVLDTNVLSEVLKPAPDERVLHWLADLDPAAVFTTAVTQAEILSGVEILPTGRRRAQLLQAVEDMFATDFGGRILAFDDAAARAFAQIATVRESIGRPISQFDAMIAAIVRSHRGEAIATRNTTDFERCGINVMNPWTA